MSRARVLLVLTLLAVLAAVAVYDAYRGARDGELAVVRLEVDALRQAMLSQEAARLAKPLPCGSASEARAAAGKNAAENLGQCGLNLFGREPKGPSPYFISVAPGAVDFTVVGYATRQGQLVEVRASRAQRAAIVENKE